MIFIDWISPPAHKNFNRSFFSALQLSQPECHVFSSALVLPEVKCVLHAPSLRRWGQALKVLALLWIHRHNDIVLLTYDPLFLPLAVSLKPSILVFEHNTTPEEGFSIRCLWQQLFFFRVRRLAQFQGQFERLQRMGGRVTYIGSPLLVPDADSSKHSLPNVSCVFLAPSSRAALSELDRFAHCLATATIVVKRTPTDSCQDGGLRTVHIKQVDWIEIAPQGRKVDGIIITIQSRIRGTGWFNDAIGYQIPVMTTNANASQLFEDTFPDYPFINLEQVSTAEELNCLLARIRAFNSHEYVVQHNQAFRTRFVDLCLTLGVMSAKQ
jgi:hypothetical protein